MQVSTIDQIGNTLPSHAKASGARARASNQFMNVPSSVFDSDSKEGNSSRQDFPIETHKIDGAERGRPLTAPAGLTQAFEKLTERSAEHPDSKGLSVAQERIQSNIERYMAQISVAMPPAPDVPSVETTA
ncbi:MAG: hypothetical protein NT140_05125 [Deltaproteobacteria bacterium]|nr:hypothetical protein [Deltaproteobacteria bacterium]